MLLRVIIGTAWANVGRDPGTGQLFSNVRRRKCPKSMLCDQGTQERPTYAASVLSLRTIHRAVTRAQRPERGCQKAVL